MYLSLCLVKNGSNAGGADSLDDYMSSLGTSMDKTTRTQIRRKVFELKKVLDVVISSFVTCNSRARFLGIFWNTPAILLLGAE